MVGEGRNQMLMYVGQRVGVLAEQIGGDAYPPSPNGRPLDKVYTLDNKPSKFKTRKQRGYFFVSLKHGSLRIPYRRSGTLGKSLSSRTELIQDGAVIYIGTNLNYAKYVIGLPDEQFYYHVKTGWESLPTVIAGAIADLLVEAETATNEFLTDYIKAGL